MNCASRWFGLDRATPSRSSIAEVEMAQVSPFGRQPSKTA
jgi:hypothetical protein